MDIRISKESDVPVRQQLAEQIVFQIATEKLKPGQALPSVRELARRLKIHHNTVSHAYQELAKRRWLVRRRGSRVLVRAQAHTAGPSAAEGLDELINMTIQAARERGYSLQALGERLRQRMMAEPPDHILVVDQEPGLRCLLREEIQAALGWPVEDCAREDLAANGGLAIGALVVAPQYAIEDVKALMPNDRQTIPVVFSAADEHLERIRRLEQSSVIAVVSVSVSFLKTAQSLLAPAVGRRHSLCQFLLPLDDLRALRGADVIFCDTIALPHVASPKAVHYRLVAPTSLEYLRSAMDSSERA
jgi:DNA-binding transcriptional regulator YhcF (GntR family)